MSFKIITDSASGLTKEIIDRYNILIVPLSYIDQDGKEYIPSIESGEEGHKDFYQKMREKYVFKTSCANEETFTNVFKKVLDDGKDVLYFSLSSGLSATYTCAKNAATALEETYKDRKILVLDTLNASLGEGLTIYTACLLKEKGATIEEVYQNAIDTRLNLNSLFTVKSLTYLARGGRISKVSMLVGNAIDIKPVMYVNNTGKLVAFNKVIGRKRSILSIADKVAKTIINPEEQTIFISHGDCIEDAEFLALLIKQRVPVKDFVFNYIDAAIGSHSGPDTLAVFYYGLSREETIKTNALASACDNN